jgi:hypothetical protein
MAVIDDIYRLSDNFGVIYNVSDGHSVTLYDISDFSEPVRKATLTAGEMNGLYNLWCDGCCPICLNAIPQDDIICVNCFRDASAVERERG